GVQTCALPIYSPSCLSQCGEKGIHNGESAEDIDFEFVPDSVKRQNLQGAGRQDSSVAYEKIHAAFILDCDFARPNFDGGFVSNVALAQIDRPTRRLFEVRDLV